MVSVRVPEREVVESVDDCIVLPGVSFELFEALLESRGDVPVPRMAYLDGVLEFITPSRSHEMIKSWIGALLETYAEVSDIDLSPYGSWLLKRSKSEAGAEPDESYILGTDQTKAVPDLVIEVLWSQRRLDKFEIYRRLDVRELWLWRDQTVEIYLLGQDDYTLSERSEAFPDLDLSVLLSCLEAPSLTAAKRLYRKKLSDLGLER